MGWQDWIEPGVIIGVMLFVWNRIDSKIEKLDLKMDKLGSDLRADIKNLDSKIEVVRTEFRGETKSVEDKIWYLHTQRKDPAENIEPAISRVKGVE